MAYGMDKINNKFTIAEGSKYNDHIVSQTKELIVYEGVGSPEAQYINEHFYNLSGKSPSHTVEVFYNSTCLGYYDLKHGTKDANGTYWFILQKSH